MNIESMTCMNCGTEIKPGYAPIRDEHINIPEQDWEGCDVKIRGGYSSDFDLQEFHGVICTACLRKAMPNLYQVQRLDEARPKFHYFPKGETGHREWKPNRSPQDDQRILDSL